MRGSDGRVPLPAGGAGDAADSLATTIGTAGTGEERSTPGAGSAFSVRLPLTDNAHPAMTAPEPPTPVVAPAKPAGQRVLVVDDDPLLCMALSSMIRHWGYEMVHASSWTEAQAKLAVSAPPELVVTDYHLGEGTTGIDLLAALTSRSGSPVRGILLTGETGAGLMAEAEALGCVVLHKPVAPRTMRRALAGE